MLFFVHHCELPGYRHIRLPLREGGHVPILLPPLQDLVPDLRPPHVMRFNLQFAAQQPGNLVGPQPHFDVNVLDAPLPVTPPQVVNQRVPVNVPQENIEATNLPPAQNQSLIDQNSVRRRNVPVGTTLGGATLAEEVDPRVASELVSGSSVTLAPRRGVVNTSLARLEDDNLTPGLRDESSLLTRESIRTARLHRFGRTSMDSINQ